MIEALVALLLPMTTIDPFVMPICPHWTTFAGDHAWMRYDAKTDKFYVEYFELRENAVPNVDVIKRLRQRGCKLWEQEP